MTTQKQVTELAGELINKLPTLTKPRRDLIAFAVFSIIQVCSISLHQIALGMASKALPLSSFRRLQRFISQIRWESSFLIPLIVEWVAIQGPYTLLIDRTHWRFGSQEINILCISILGQKYSIPIAWVMLNKKGNSNQAERINLMESVLNALGSWNIEWVVADREFGGPHFYKFLNDNKISFAIRIKKNQLVKRYGRLWRVTQLIQGNTRNGNTNDGKRYWLAGIQVYIHGFRIRKDGGPLEHLIVASQVKDAKVIEIYRNRWYIENMFKDMKSNGLHIEATHVQNLERLHTLLGLIVLAQAWAIRIGKYIINKSPRFFKKAKHKRPRKSVFKAGLEAIRRAFLTQDSRSIWIYIRFLSCT